MTDLRRATEGDSETLHHLGAATFKQTFEHLYKPDDLNAFLAESHSVEFYEGLLRDPKCAVWIAESDSKSAIGYCVAGPCSLPVSEMPARSGELKRLYVDIKAQRTGLGRAMLEVALQWLNAQFDHVYLGVYAENKRAQTLYKAYDFEKAGDYVYMVGDHPDPEWIMKQRSR